MMLSQGFHPLHRDNAIECGGSGGGASARRLLAPDIRFFATVEDKITVFGSTSTSTPHSSSSSCAGVDDCEEMSDSEQCPTVVMLSQKHGLPVETTSSYNRMDVLLGRGRAFQLYPGNRRFHALINSNVDRYVRADAQTGKWKLTMDLVEKILQQGRFLKPAIEGQSSGEWIVIGKNEARQKVAHALQYQNRRILRKKQRQQEKLQKQKVQCKGDDISIAKHVDSPSPLSSSRRVGDVPVAMATGKMTTTASSSNISVSSSSTLPNIPVAAELRESPSAITDAEASLGLSERGQSDIQAVVETSDKDHMCLLDQDSDEYWTDECWLLLQEAILETENGDTRGGKSISMLTATVGTASGNRCGNSVEPHTTPDVDVAENETELKSLWGTSNLYDIFDGMLKSNDGDSSMEYNCSGSVDDMEPLAAFGPSAFVTFSEASSRVVKVPAAADKVQPIQVVAAIYPRGKRIFQATADEIPPSGNATSNGEEEHMGSIDSYQLFDAVHVRHSDVDPNNGSVSSLDLFSLHLDMD